jgi:prevent-host-death family protein
MDKSTMPKLVSALTARTQFGQIMKRAKEKRDRFVVGRRGEPQVVIMGVKDFIDTIAPEPEFLRLIGEEAKRKGKNKLTMRQIDAEIRAARRERRLKYATPKDRT